MATKVSAQPVSVAETSPLQSERLSFARCKFHFLFQLFAIYICHKSVPLAAFANRCAAPR